MTIPICAILVVGSLIVNAVHAQVLRGEATPSSKLRAQDGRRQIQEDAVANGFCPLPPAFSPNRFYDGLSDCSLSPESMDVLKIESAAFRYLVAQSDRIRRVNYTSCFVKAIPGGRPYFYDNFAVHGVVFLDLMQQLQLLPDHCTILHEPLRQLLLSQMSVPMEDLTVEYVTSYDPRDPPPMEWWQDEFLPTLANAFSCGFTSPMDEDSMDESALPGEIVSSDIREQYLAGDATIQRVWRLIKGYLRSPQKQREFMWRGQDFDVSHYVPFLKVPMASIIMEKTGIRSGFPTYSGPPIWFLYHTMAARTAALERQCEVDATKINKIIQTFATLITYFGTTHPCPYCREHFMSRVSRNDQDWQAFGLVNSLSPSQSESNLYPLEYLFAGGADPNQSGSLKSKLASIVDGNSFMLYLWKQHNTVSASTSYNLNCRDGEQVDPDGLFRCTEEGPTYGDNGICGTRTMGRSWPTARRFEYWLRQETLWNDTRSNEGLRNAYQSLKDLDEEHGQDLRQSFWTRTNETNVTTAMLDMGQVVLKAVSALDSAMLATNVLYTEYSLSTPVMCEVAMDSLQRYEPLAVPLPLMQDGNFRGPSDACIESIMGQAQRRQLLQDGEAVRRHRPGEQCDAD